MWEALHLIRRQNRNICNRLVTPRDYDEEWVFSGDSVRRRPITPAAALLIFLPVKIVRFLKCTQGGVFEPMKRQLVVLRYVNEV